MEEYQTVNVPSIVFKGIEYLVKLSEKVSPNGFVETDNDWKILVETFKVWRRLYPDVYMEFLRTMRDYNVGESINKGMVKEGGAFIQHRLEVPYTLHRFFTQMFPNLKYDRKFIKRFVRELPDFDLGHD